MREPIPTAASTFDLESSDVARLFALIADGVQGSVLLTGQTASRDLRRGRYTPASMEHPGKMLPTIPRYLTATYTQPGDLVVDPMAGIGTTVVEAMHLGRHGIGVEYENRWAQHAADNVRLAASQGATGTGEVYTGDARRLPALLPSDVHGRVSLVITSPPYGPSTHGHVRTPGPRRGKVRKIHHRYGADTGNLAYTEHAELAEGFTQILTGCAAVLRPGGYVAVTARPYRRRGELIDIPGMVAAAGLAAGLTLVEELVALIAGVRDGVLVPRTSFFQMKNVRDAINTGDPQWLIQHEDLLLFQLGRAHDNPQGSAPSRSTLAAPHAGHGLDDFTPTSVDRRAHPAHPANPGGSATHIRSQRGRNAGRTPAPCPLPHPTPGSERPDTNAHQRPTGPDAPRQQAGPSDTAGRL
ncbi:TRM11 family SAM-dependent methyltransferase [Micromonospora marina]|uniref:TRM11 family SAM-dependent methyltransferase n=1 Tax=Micromonospora marina TaxID=307120 RepID=UPI003D71AD9C